MLKVGDRIGYIRKIQTDDGKGFFEYIESEVQSIYMGKTVGTVKTKRFSKLYLDEIESNTEYMNHKSGAILILEPFATNDELAARCKAYCDFWNEQGTTGVIK